MLIQLCFEILTLRLSRLSFVCLAVFILTPNLRAVGFDVQFVAGSEQALLESPDVGISLGGYQARTALHISPNDRWPVAIGGSLSTTRYYQNNGDTFFKLQQLSVGSMELLMWTPYRFLGIQAYVKGATIIQGHAESKVS